MAEVSEDRDRQVVPRWRSFTAASEFGELSSLYEPKQTFSANTLEQTLEDWERQPTLSVAADLTSIAFATGQVQPAQDAARFVLGHKWATSAAKTMARRCLQDEPTGANEEFSESYAQPSNLDDLQVAIRSARSRLNRNPINPILWTNLSLFYTILGFRDKAEQAMRIALSLAPENRFVLRAGCRLYLHHGDPERAHDLLLNNSLLKHDPWILAGEIAVSAARAKTSRNMRRGRMLLESQNFRPFDLSELSAAIATQEASSGKMKSARQLCRASLRDPAENAIAQIGWMNRRIIEFNMPSPGSIQSSEANAWVARRRGEWEPALVQAKKWQSEQPFSSRPALLAGSIASTVLENFVEAESVLRNGLQSNRDDATLHNNLAFALANQGRLADATETIDRAAELPNRTIVQNICLTATTGLIQFRAGNHEGGRLLYASAIAAAVNRNLNDVASQARTYLALEEIRAGSDFAEPAKSEALDSLRHHTLDPLRLVFEQKLRNARPAITFA